MVAPSIELNVFYHVSGDIDGGSAFQKAISAEPPFATCNFLLKLKRGNKFVKKENKLREGKVQLRAIAEADAAMCSPLRVDVLEFYNECVLAGLCSGIHGLW